ncbi:hypothetical protein [Candidatus Methylacidiphilum fumarolicum]|uniref:Uncharacterized protein n=1 Tax=Candidatus Methylacidiphilum fumarolicum TaxID=591154 RepID=A0ABM9IC18_9BACT|nr:hypothetical protein [Candidatus Methylacidiphilum fumarolicum]CAI9085213.1 protein of unknown function [Candidatus Methylacidiphilum fumarolicum]
MAVSLHCNDLLKDPVPPKMGGRKAKRLAYWISHFAQRLVSVLAHVW